MICQMREILTDIRPRLMPDETLAADWAQEYTVETIGHLLLKEVMEESEKAKDLTEDEIKHLDLASGGLPVAKVAEKLGVTDDVLKYHRILIFQKRPDKSLTRIVFEGFITGELKYTPDGRGKTQPEITERRMEVADLICMGLSDKEIAKKLSIADDTVKSHVNAVRSALGAKNRTHVPRRLFETGIYQLP